MPKSEADERYRLRMHFRFGVRRPGIRQGGYIRIDDRKTSTFDTYDAKGTGLGGNLSIDPKEVLNMLQAQYPEDEMVQAWLQEGAR